MNHPLRIRALLVAATLVVPVITRAQTPPAFIASWGTQGSGAGQFNGPTGIAVDTDGNVYVADRDNHRIQKFSGNGTYLGQWGTQGSSNGQFQSPEAVAVSRTGDVYVADTGNNRIQEFTTSGAYVAQWGEAGTGAGQFNQPFGVTVDAAGEVFVIDRGNARVQVFSPAGTYAAGWSSTTYDCASITSDAAGYIYIASRFRLRKFTADGSLVSYAITQYGSFGLAVDQQGLVFVSNDEQGTLMVYQQWLGSLHEWWWLDSAGPRFQLAQPEGLALDEIGNLFVVNHENGQVLKFGPLTTPTITSTWGSVKNRYR